MYTLENQGTFQRAHNDVTGIVIKGYETFDGYENILTQLFHVNKCTEL